MQFKVLRVGACVCFVLIVTPQQVFYFAKNAVFGVSSSGELELGLLLNSYGTLRQVTCPLESQLPVKMERTPLVVGRAPLSKYLFGLLVPLSRPVPSLFQSILHTAATCYDHVSKM